MPLMSADNIVPLLGNLSHLIEFARTDKKNPADLSYVVEWILTA